MNTEKPIPIYLANPRGFCAGVDRAIEIVNHALERFGAPIYVRHEVVHNKTVVSELKAKGAIFVKHLAEAPDHANLIFSAHGVSLQIQAEAKARHLNIFDATCPLVTKVHLQVSKFAKQGKDVILIGHAGHPEVEGTLGQYTQNSQGKAYLVETVADAKTIPINKPDNLAFVTQTTLSMDDTEDIIHALQQRFPQIDSPKKEDICYATQNRQNAIKSLCEHVDLILVVGSPNSSNSNRLAELAIKLNVPAYLIDNASEIQAQWFEGIHSIGISSGASAPEHLVDQVINHLEQHHNMACDVARVRTDEKVKFPLPANLRIITQ